MGPYGGLNSEKIHKIRTATCSTITYKTKKNNKTVREVKLRKCLNSKVTGLISTLWPQMQLNLAFLSNLNLDLNINLNQQTVEI